MAVKTLRIRPFHRRGGVEVFRGDCREVLPALGRFDSIVTDPPYGFSFMLCDWDRGVPGVGFWRAVLAAAKPGAHLLAFGGTRTFHRLVCAVEDAGWEVRDVVMWLYGTGFPKSLDVGKAIDRRRDDLAQIYEVTAWVRAARNAAGVANAEIDAAFATNGMARHWTDVPPRGRQPAVPTLEQVPRLLAVLGDPEVPPGVADLLIELNGRKGQPGEAWFRREVVGRRRDGSRGGVNTSILTGTSVEYDVTAPATTESRRWDGWGTALKPAYEPIILARKPLDGTVARNVLAHGVGGLHVDACRVGTSKGVPTSVGTRNLKDLDCGWGLSAKGNTKGRDANVGRWPANVVHDGSDEATASMGEAERYFYCAKASRRERGEGNDHPTVKPQALMRWLVRLVTPPGGTVLDPFAGSGSTLLAARAEGFRAVGIELEERYARIAARRIGGPRRKRLARRPRRKRLA